VGAGRVADSVAGVISPLMQTSPDTPPIHTIDSLAGELAACGLAPGQTVVMHSSMSKIGGYIVGGAEAVIRAVLEVLTPDGTLVMPALTDENTDPSRWSNPPVPESFWPIIRAHTPAYDPARTPTWNLGVIPELFRTWPGAHRSGHPIASFAAVGKHAAYLTNDHRLMDEFGATSPIGRLYELDGYVLLLGVGHGNNTSLHMAEWRANWPGKKTFRDGTAMYVDGARQWVEFDALDFDDRDFERIGDAYEAEHGIPRGRVGSAEVRFVKQRPLIDYAVQWIEKNRP
jgi:aminoglycoside 3-N-acetyltransferase